MHAISENLLLNTLMTGNQTGSQSVQLADGRVLVVWESKDLSFGSTTEIRGRLLSPGGQPIGNDFSIARAGAASDFKILAGATGGFSLVVAEVTPTDGFFPRQSEVWLQNFSNVGVAQSVRERLELTLYSDLSDPDIVRLPNGRLAVSWSDGDDVVTQIRTGIGAFIGGSFEVNRETAYEQTAPRTAILSNGALVSVWNDPTPNDVDIRGQIYLAGGTRVGATLNATEGENNGFRSDAQVTALAGGTFIVTWSDGDVKGQIYNSSGSRLGAVKTINQQTEYGQADASVALLSDGRFVVSWTDGSPGDTEPGSGVKFRIYGVDGRPESVERWVVTGALGDQSHSTVTALAGNRFVISWTDGTISDGDPSGTAIHSRSFDSNVLLGTRVGTVNSDRIEGTSVNERFWGLGGADTLLGGSGDDVLRGGIGSDRLIGGLGRDLLYGGDDNVADTFVFSAINNSVKGSRHDVVNDFDRGIDIIDLSIIDANTDTSGSQNFFFSGVSARANSVWGAGSGSGFVLRGDVNGDAVFDFEIGIAGLNSISRVDIIG